MVFLCSLKGFHELFELVDFKDATCLFRGPEAEGCLVEYCTRHDNLKNRRCSF